MGDRRGGSGIDVVAGVDNADIHPGKTSYPGECEISDTARRPENAGTAAPGCDGGGGVTFHCSNGNAREKNTGDNGKDGSWKSKAVVE